jgi:hypothetical protein
MGVSYNQWREWVTNLGHPERAAEHPAASGRSEGDVLRERFGIGEEAPASKAPDDGMNKSETLFSEDLECMKQRGEIKEWAFEPEKFRMADRTWWKPDFRMTLLSGQNVFVEVKVARKDGSILWTDDGAVKAKTVPEMHPYAFFLAIRHHRHWKIIRLPSRNYGWIKVDLEWRL